VDETGNIIRSRTESNCIRFRFFVKTPPCRLLPLINSSNKAIIACICFCFNKGGDEKGIVTLLDSNSRISLFVPTLLADIVPISPSHNICQSLSRGLLMGTYLNSRNEPRIRSKPRYCKPGQSPNLTLRSLRTQLFATRVCR
jgi:hypothetical protein